jgi:hypothetical protein
MDRFSNRLFQLRRRIIGEAGQVRTMAKASLFKGGIYLDTEGAAKTSSAVVRFRSVVVHKDGVEPTIAK